MTLAKLIPLAIQFSMAIVIFCVALKAHVDDVARRCCASLGLLIRSLVSMLVVMPALAVAFAVAFDLHDAVEIALVASALSPVPPILPGKQIKAGGHASYVIGLLLSSALVAIVYVPMMGHPLGTVFHRPVQVDMRSVAVIVGTSMLLPVLAGMTIRRLAPARGRPASQATVDLRHGVADRRAGAGADQGVARDLVTDRPFQPGGDDRVRGDRPDGGPLVGWPGPRRSQCAGVGHLCAPPCRGACDHAQRRRSAGRDGGRAAGAGGQFDRFHSYVKWRRRVHQAPPPDGHSQVM